jgi:multiple sugar transport system permease protein
MVFVTPAILFFSVFYFYPILSAFITGLTNRRILSLKPPDFVGFTNFRYLLESSDFWNSVRATFTFTFGTFIPLLVFSLLLAVLVSQLARAKRFLQMAYYSPAVLSSVVAAAIWLTILEPRGLANQIMNTLLGTAGIDHRWLADATMVQLSTIMVYFWKYVGYFVVIFITGLATIPRGIYEAAIIDGADRWQSFWRITLPLLRPTVALVSVMSMLQCLKTFSTQYLFTQSGAPQAPINVITLNIYNTGIRDHLIGRASAMSILLFVLMLAFTGLQLRVTGGNKVSY